MENLFSLKGKTAIITGGYGYLGQDMAKTLDNFGAKVYVLGKSKEKFDGVFKSFDNVSFVEMDLSDSVSIKTAIQNVVDTEGAVDILVNNGYYGAANNPTEMTNNEWEVGIDGGLNSVFRCILEVIPHMINKESGKIINIASMYGLTVPDFDVYKGFEDFLNPPNYGVAKSGVLHMTKYYASYLGKFGITVNAISPGAFPSKLVQKKKGFIDNLVDNTALKRIGDPKDLRGTLILLASSASDYITGQNMVVDGGWTIK